MIRGDYMIVNTEHMEVKKKIERLGMLLLENSEKVTQVCIKEDDVENLNELITILQEKLCTNTEQSI